VERKSVGDWVKNCQELDVEGKVGRGRCRKTWRECVRGDLKDFGLKVEDTKNGDDWRKKVFGKTSEPCKQGKNGR